MEYEFPTAGACGHTWGCGGVGRVRGRDRQCHTSRGFRWKRRCLPRSSEESALERKRACRGFPARLSFPAIRNQHLAFSQSATCRCPEWA